MLGRGVLTVPGGTGLGLLGQAGETEQHTEAEVWLPFKDRQNKGPVLPECRAWW